MVNYLTGFTLPEGLLPLAVRFPNAIYNALFSAASWVLKDWFQYKHQLIPGIVAVLHTAGFALKRHIHLHMLVTGGGVRNGRWHELELYPVRYVLPCGIG